jgi:spore germination cell wall hydrolase CwlJ-like protein
LFNFSSFSRRNTAPAIPHTPRAFHKSEIFMHRTIGVGRFAAIGAALAFAGGCTPDHIARNADHLGQAARARLAAAPAARPAQPRLAIQLQAPPARPFPALATREAEQLNAARPFDAGPIEPMQPFVLKTDAGDRTRAVNCLAQAVYYEAAREPLSGQQAVAQVVLNRLRHPAYPKSVCGVVYQGAAKATGCQFTFTCDGSLRWRPEPAVWDRAQAVARQALAGYVDREVGSATSYHAAYVAPYWAPSLVKMTQVGQHIFYRRTGAWGEPAAFTGRYAGREAVLTPAVLGGGEAGAPVIAPRQVTLSVAGGGRTYKVAEVGGADGRTAGVLQPTRRQPTQDEVKRINDHLAALEEHLDAEAAGGGPG